MVASVGCLLVAGYWGAGGRSVVARVRSMRKDARFCGVERPVASGATCSCFYTSQLLHNMYTNVHKHTHTHAHTHTVHAPAPVGTGAAQLGYCLSMHIFIRGSATRNAIHIIFYGRTGRKNSQSPMFRIATDVISA